ncbi:unnamed protein product [Pleuronectes platessa]|uniref:Uncharacterized protein n=1 Tax=Pleuronectes platessa TaxID=8262 RepID=A0A9N7UT25_PLEPL|nr:unnamed protein product [Pleuronectes platessa]
MLGHSGCSWCDRDVPHTIAGYACPRHGLGRELRRQPLSSSSAAAQAPPSTATRLLPPGLIPPHLAPPITDGWASQVRGPSPHPHHSLPMLPHQADSATRSETVEGESRALAITARAGYPGRHPLSSLSPHLSSSLT